jgi:UV DNA damage endonuclease
MRVGYACVNTSLPSASRTVRLANATPERLREVIAVNLDALGAILAWNVAHGIAVFRVSSDTIPFGSHPANALDWRSEFAPELKQLGALMRKHEMSISTHPGQYTVLGSPNAQALEASLAELEYHDSLLSGFGLGPSHKVVIHVGGAYGDRTAAVSRFAAAVSRLSPGARARLTVENDERWSLAEVLEQGAELRLPVVFDAFHHRLLPSLPELSMRDAILLAGKTWSPKDGRQEIHFSTQQPGKRPGAHSETLDLGAFERFAATVHDLAVDCIVEVKDKERSALAAQRLLVGASVTA